MVCDVPLERVAPADVLRAVWTLFLRATPVHRREVLSPAGGIHSLPASDTSFVNPCTPNATATELRSVEGAKVASLATDRQVI